MDKSALWLKAEENILKTLLAEVKTSKYCTKQSVEALIQGHLNVIDRIKTRHGE